MIATPLGPAVEGPDALGRGVTGSLVLHAGILALAVVALPWARPDFPTTPPPLVVDVITVTDQTEFGPAKGQRKPAEAKAAPKAPPKPAPKAATEPVPKPAAKPAVKPVPTKPAPSPDTVAAAPPPKPATTASSEPAPAPAPRAKPESAPEPKPAAKPQVTEPARPAAQQPPPLLRDAAPPRKPQTPEAAAKPEPAPKPPAATAPKDQPDRDAEDFASVLAAVKDLKRAEPSRPADPPAAAEKSTFESQIARALEQTGPAPAPSAAAGSGAPLSVSEIDAIRRQIERCWNVPAGARDAADLVVQVAVEMGQNGIPRTAVIVDQQRLQSDRFFRTAAESAQRAVLNPRCHPFTLPPDKYDRWKSLTLVFNPKEMLGP